MSPVQLERRARQRFDFNLPVSLRLADGRTGSGFTQNLSARGLFLCTDMSLAEGEAIELTLSMPSEVTLSDAMRVRCQAKLPCECWQPAPKPSLLPPSSWKNTNICPRKAICQLSPAFPCRRTPPKTSPLSFPKYCSRAHPSGPLPAYFFCEEVRNPACDADLHTILDWHLAGFCIE